MGVNCLSLEPSFAGYRTMQEYHTISHLGKSWPWHRCYSCSTSASSTCTQCCWDDEDSYLRLFLLLSAALGSCLFRLCDTMAAKRGARITAGITAGTRRDLLLLWPCYPSPFCSFSALPGPLEPFCSTFWYPWLDCTLTVQGLSDVILPLFILVAVETLGHSPKMLGFLLAVFSLL